MLEKQRSLGCVTFWQTGRDVAYWNTRQRKMTDVSGSEFSELKGIF